MSGLRPALSTLLFLMLITGGVYPLLTTALGQWWFPTRLTVRFCVRSDNSRFCTDRAKFYRRGLFSWTPSATAEMPYNPMASGGSNLAASNPELDKQLQSRITALRAANPQANPAVPVELVTASASGLDNNLTPAAVARQIPAWRRLATSALKRSRARVAQYTQKPLVSFIGQPVVNPVELNLALDKH